MDSNQGMFPLTFAIVDADNEANWFWFLNILQSIVSPNRKLGRNNVMVGTLKYVLLLMRSYLSVCTMAQFFRLIATLLCLWTSMHNFAHVGNGKLLDCHAHML